MGLKFKSLNDLLAYLSLNQTYNGIEMIEHRKQFVNQYCLNQTYNGIEISNILHCFLASLQFKSDL